MRKTSAQRAIYQTRRCTQVLVISQILHCIFHITPILLMMSISYFFHFISHLYIPYKGAEHQKYGEPVPLVVKKREAPNSYGVAKKSKIE